MAPRIAIVTPSYNQGPFIERTIRGVLDQGVDLEYVVMDGGSTDETLWILRRYEDRLRWISEKDLGQAHAVNKAVADTSAPVIGWLNSDDIYYPRALATVLDIFDRNADVDVVYGQAHHIDLDDGVINQYTTEPWNIERLAQWCFLCQPAAFFRRSVVERFGPLDESLHYCLDYEYWLRLAQGGAKFAYVERMLAGSRMHEQNKTLGQRYKMAREIATMCKRRLGKVADPWLVNYAQARWENSRMNTLSRELMMVGSYMGAWMKWNHRISPVGTLRFVTGKGRNLVARMIR